MTVESLEHNGNQLQEGQTATEGQDNQVVALSVQPNQGRQPLRLKVDQDHALPNNRPIEASHLEIVRTFSTVGSSRPIVKSKINFGSQMTVYGNRPVSGTTLKISETYTVMGNRPVASNEIDDPVSLMGYID